MAKIEVRQLSEEEIEKMGIRNWPTWSSPVQKFPWEYTTTEVCYFLEGRVIVETEDGEKVEIKKGDFVRFPAGLRCTWDVIEPVKKHYNFE